MPNENISFNSIDDLQHFRTTEDVFGMNTSSQHLSDARLMDSAHFLTEPIKREAGEVFGPPVISQADDSLPSPEWFASILSSDYHKYGYSPTGTNQHNYQKVLLQSPPEI